MDYGFASWNDLMAEVDARTGKDPEFDPAVLDARFAPAGVKSEGDRTWLSPIPRFPYTVHWVDENGQTVRHEREPALRCRDISNLFCAMNMTGRPVDACEVAVAAGAAFRLAFEPRWAQDMEVVTDVDEFSQACQTLGYRGEWTFQDNHADALAAIDDAIAAGRPALLTGWGERFGRLVIGYDRAAQEYRCIGGDEWEGGVPMPDVHLGDTVPLRLTWDQCAAWPRPQKDWFGLIPHPIQVARNPVFVLTDTTNVPAAERIVRTLDQALRMNRDYQIHRTNFEHRQHAIDNGPRGHDGWKFTFSPWPTTFHMGSRAMRACADHIASMVKPTYDFEMIHGIDTSFGRSLVARSRQVVAWLRHIDTHVPPSARPHLDRAREKFTQLAKFRATDLGVIRTRPCFGDEPNHDTELHALQNMLTSEPALIYLLSEPETQRVILHGVEGKGSPWGWRVLPSQDLFEQKRDAAVAFLHHLADVRDAAFESLAAVRKAM
jgi:hypothetical protein